MVITIKNEQVNASIDSMGAQLISFQDAAGKEYIWQRDPKIWPRCSPLLFPVVGNCRDNRTLFDGAWYEMPKHGFCKESDFAVSAQSADSVTFTLSDNDYTRQFYPFAFSLSLTYRLEGEAILMDYRVENGESSRTLPYYIGAHPGFICPMNEGEHFSDYQLEFAEEEDTVSIPYDNSAMAFDPSMEGVALTQTRILPLHYPLFDDDAVYFEKIRSRKVSLVHSGTHRGVEVAYPDFESIAFWTPSHTQAPFLCVEPWNGSAIFTDEDDDFTHRHQLQTLEPHQSRSYHLQIRLV